ncbi:MAG TPA: hypothetical protein VG734_27315 [Lacunisphaera sp.]|nr:hypothetical protein [Lacunisphaera sp.]
MKILLLLFTFVAVTCARADQLGTDIKIIPTRGWIAEEAPRSEQSALAYPTLRYAPKDGRNASIILTLLPNNAAGFKVTNHASLERFNLLSARPYLSDQEEEPAPVVLDVANGIGVCITNVDPALIGKPVPPGEYRIATSASVLLVGKYLIHCTIFYDEKDSTDYREALEILLSARVQASPADARSTNI